MNTMNGGKYASEQKYYRDSNKFKASWKWGGRRDVSIKKEKRKKCNFSKRLTHFLGLEGKNKKGKKSNLSED